MQFGCEARYSKCTTRAYVGSLALTSGGQRQGQRIQISVAYTRIGFGEEGKLSCVAAIAPVCFRPIRPPQLTTSSDS